MMPPAPKAGLIHHQTSVKQPAQAIVSTRLLADSPGHGAIRARRRNHRPSGAQRGVAHLGLGIGGVVDELSDPTGADLYATRPRRAQAIVHAKGLLQIVPMGFYRLAEAGSILKCHAGSLGEIL